MSDVDNYLGIQPVDTSSAILPYTTLGPESFLTFECAVCKHLISLMERLEPGQAAGMECDNCGLSWSVYAPPLEVHRTDKFEMIWPIIAQ